MNDILDIKLHLSTKSGNVSLLNKQVYEEELKEINKKFPLKRNQINIVTVYAMDYSNSVEVGFFIRSTINRYISFEDIQLVLKNKSGNIITSQKFNLKNLGTIPPNTGIPTSVEFTKHGRFEFDKEESYTIQFSNVEELTKFSTVNAEIENMPANIEFEVEKEILDYASGLETLRANEISISVFKFVESQDKGIDVTLLLRNGYDRDVKLEVLPIKVLNYNDTIVGKEVFRNPDGLVSISARKSKLIKFHLNPSKLYTTIFDPSKCKVVFEE